MLPVLLYLACHMSMMHITENCHKDTVPVFLWAGYNCLFNSLMIFRWMNDYEDILYLIIHFADCKLIDTFWILFVNKITFLYLTFAILLSALKLSHTHTILILMESFYWYFEY